MNCPHCQLMFKPIQIRASVIDNSDRVYISAVCDHCQKGIQAFVSPAWEHGGEILDILTDQALRKFFVPIAERQPPYERGHFLTLFAQTFLQADWENIKLLNQPAIALIHK